MDSGAVIPCFWLWRETNARGEIFARATDCLSRIATLQIDTRDPNKKILAGINVVPRRHAPENGSNAEETNPRHSDA